MTNGYRYVIVIVIATALIGKSIDMTEGSATRFKKIFNGLMINFSFFHLIIYFSYCGFMSYFYHKEKIINLNTMMGIHLLCPFYPLFTH